MSLTAPYDPENIFAKILRGDLPCIKVFEDDASLAFMDIFPQTKGHTLVVPKAGATNIFEITPETLQGLITRVQTISTAVREALNPDGVFVAQFNGAEAGQTVFHIHFHVIPRYAGEPYKGHGESAQADPNELEETAALIRAAL